VYNVNGLNISSQVTTAANTWTTNFKQSVSSSADSVCLAASQCLTASFLPFKNQVHNLIF
jgi:hypothetical protein